MKQKEEFLRIDAVEKLFYLVQIRKLLAYHFNMIDSVFNIYITALLKTECIIKFFQVNLCADLNRRFTKQAL